MEKALDTRPPGSLASSSSRLDDVQAPIVPIVAEWIRETPGTISLGQGVVHYGPPPDAIEAARASLSLPSTHQYQNGAGLPELVAAVERKLACDNHIDVADGSRVMVTAGANMAFMHAVLATTRPGDEVVLLAPFYFNHEMAIEIAGCRAVCVPTDGRYQPRVEAIAAALGARTRAVVTISPNNPSGAVYEERLLREVNALCRQKGVYHISDETYEYFTYGPSSHVSPGSFRGAAEHTISLYSLSKAYGFAGWRIGYLAYPAALEGAMVKTQDTILICPPVVSQIAAAAAMQVGRAYCEPHVRELAAIRDNVVSGLAALAPRVRVPAADGAFYCLLQVEAGRPGAAPGGALTSMRLAERLVREHGVAVIPGSAFGMSEGCSLRVAYGALQRATVAEGLDRLIGGLRAILG
jgi:aspartate/methionine/tyrosine aminotransferase